MNYSLPYETIAVFTDSRQGFKGNPSSVILTEKEIPEVEMQAIAKRLGQPATTFLRPTKDADVYMVRWFAPDAEIGLCGHGAGAAGVFLGKNHSITSCRLLYGEGEIQAGFYPEKESFSLTLNPISVKNEIEVPHAIQEGLGIPVLAMYATGNKHIILTDSEKSVTEMKPSFDKLRESDIFGYAVTARGEKADFVSRTLVPHVQQLEDFATGSSHAMLAPFWADRMGRRAMVAHQLSQRGGLFRIGWKENQLVLQGSFAKEGQGVT
ncbi:PhzF family phenazine biosynthesis protein [Pleomorphovibrio marinus]|uniref:PhzF family phenazine biosynthesis protein n=1 Tax=Pleomorphovibrio marinus TaxID=2164132 RepID=UPI000E0AB3F3|nr:PhzF family phenazine biosynthesis protein [Pleomorphovibrio marinus]